MMLSINTNLSSLIAQNSMKTSTNKLNEAIERMSTGYKINHAKDNAANYSISTNMTTRMSAYQVAEDNVAMGMDMVSTAEETLSQISDKLNRLRALQVQASNGTYGEQSLNAINAEVNALVDEIERLNNTAEYNGVKCLGNDKNPEILDKKIEIDTEKLVDNVSTFTAGETYYINSVEDLTKLSSLVKIGVDTTNVNFELCSDIDLEGVAFTPIGNSNTQTFKGNFNGNGFSIKNLNLSISTNLISLFGHTEGANIKNLNVTSCNLYGVGYVGALIGRAVDTTVENCFSDGEIGNGNNIGGLIGYAENSVIKNCGSSANTKGGLYIGGLIGYLKSSDVYDSYATGKVTSSNNLAGGLIGSYFGDSTNTILVKNCYATGNVEVQEGNAGGLIGGGSNVELSIINCYATGNVLAKAAGATGGLIGYASDLIVEQSFSIGDVTSAGANTGGLVGGIYAHGEIKNSFAECTVSSTSTNNVGGLIGYANGLGIEMCYAKTETIANASYSGSFIGFVGNLTTDANNATLKSEMPAIGSPNTSTVSSLTEDELKKSYNYKAMGFTNSAGWENVYNELKLSWEIEKESVSDNFVNLQIGINSNNDSQISFDLSFSLLYLDRIRDIGLTNSDHISQIDSMQDTVNKKILEFGTIKNRLESALDEVFIQYDNLASSRSTIRDADMTELSSTYIQQQILQQAAATLMSTANQSPAIALQLI